MAVKAGAQAMSNIGSQILSNAVLNLAGRMWPAFLAIFSMPFIVGKLGVDAYGIFILVAAVVGNMSFLDINLSIGLTKFIAADVAKQNREEINKKIQSAMLIQISIGLIGAALMSAFAYNLNEKIFKIPPNLFLVTIFVFYVSALGFFINMIKVTLSAIMEGLQRFDIISMINIFIATLLTMTTVIVLWLGFGLREVVLVNFFSACAGVIAFAIMNKRIIPWISFRPSLDRIAFSQLFRFSMWSLLGKVSYIVAFQFDRLIIGVILGPAYLAYYAISGNLATRLVDMSNALASVLLPVASGLDSLGEKEKLKDIYLRSSRLGILFGALISLPIIFLAHDILSLWLGNSFAAKGSQVLILTAIANLVVITTNVPSHFTNGLGHPRITGSLSFVQTIINVILIVPFIYLWGINGAAIAYLVPVSVLGPIFVIYATKAIFEIPLRTFLRVALLPLGAPILAMMSVLVLAHQTRLDSLPKLAFWLIGSMSLYLVTAYLSKGISTDERQLLQDYVKTWRRKPLASADILAEESL